MMIYLINKNKKKFQRIALKIKNYNLVFMKKQLKHKLLQNVFRKYLLMILMIFFNLKKFKMKLLKRIIKNLAKMKLKDLMYNLYNLKILLKNFNN